MTSAAGLVFIDFHISSPRVQIQMSLLNRLTLSSRASFSAGRVARKFYVTVIFLSSSSVTEQ